MTTESLGLTEAVSIALGGTIGGGIFAVLGVVAQLVRGATWAAFVLAGVVALCAAYSFNALNAGSDGQGGAATFVQSFTGNSTAAGMLGWTVLFGYIGSMAMYAYAFGSFAVGLDPLPRTFGGVPLRPVVSILAVAGFVGLNLLGAQATGWVETLLVGVKVAILLAFGLGGVYYGFDAGQLDYGLSRLASFDPVMAAGLSFVAFQGWQLLFYDQASFEHPVETIRRATYLAILAAIGLYVIVAITTVSPAPLDVIRAHPERALAVAADPFIPDGFTIISLAALVSTGSALNATLFSAGYFTKGMLSADLVPDHVGDASADGVPTRAVLLIGGLVAAFAAVGSLGAITTFASLTFIVVFGGVSALAVRNRDRAAISPVRPGIGVVGTTGFFGLLLWHLVHAERSTFIGVVGIAVAVLAVETLYFEREIFAEAVRAIEAVIVGGADAEA